jgi:hypothetical protein
MGFRRFGLVPPWGTLRTTSGPLSQVLTTEKITLTLLQSRKGQLNLYIRVIHRLRCDQSEQRLPESTTSSVTLGVCPSGATGDDSLDINRTLLCTYSRKLQNLDSTPVRILFSRSRTPTYYTSNCSVPSLIDQRDFLGVFTRYFLSIIHATGEFFGFFSVKYGK